MNLRGLRTLLLIHGFISLAAAIVLTLAPGLIPGTVGIHLEPSADLLAYLLAGAEFALAVLSFGGSRLSDAQALRLIAWCCIAFHGSSAVLEIMPMPRVGAAPFWLTQPRGHSSLSYLPGSRGIPRRRAQLGEPVVRLRQARDDYIAFTWSPALKL